MFCWNIGTNAVAKFVLWIRLVFFSNSDQIESWFSNEIGYAGFTYQLGVTAVILILSFFFIISNHKKCNLGKILLLVIIFVALFLTGKRSFAAMAVTIPLMISSFKKGNIIKLSFFLLFWGLLVIVFSPFCTKYRYFYRCSGC